MRSVITALGIWAIAAASHAAPIGDFVVAPPTTISALPAGVTVQPVKLTKMVMQLREGEPWADHRFRLITQTPLTWKGGRSELDVDVFGGIFADELRAAGFKVAGGESLFEESASDLQVGVLVREMRGRFCEECEFIDDGGLKGAVLMTAEWQIYSSLQRSVIGTLKTQGAFEIKKTRLGNFERIIYGAFAENVRQLIASESFRQIVSTAPSQAPSDATKLEPVRFTGAKTTATTVATAASAVVSVFANGGAMGSGFLASQDGYVLTNQHVVRDSKYVKVRWPDGREGLGEVLRVDRRRDVALVRTDASGRQPLALRSAEMQVGDTVFAVGTPLQSKLQGTVTKGIVSAHRTTDGLNFIQSDVVINSGNSGGPLLDEKAAVTGIAVSGIDLGGAPAGINFFIPIADALRALNLQPAN